MSGVCAATELDHYNLFGCLWPDESEGRRCEQKRKSSRIYKRQRMAAPVTAQSSNRFDMLSGGEEESIFDSEGNARVASQT